MSLLREIRIPLWREGRVPIERAALLRDDVIRGRGVPTGDGAPVLLVPGFMAGDLSLGLMARWLKQIGYRPCRAGIVANVDCTGRAIERLEAQLERFVERHGRPAAVVGHSRGGTMARVLAVRQPELIDTVITLGSPMTDQLAVHPVVRAQVETVALLGTLGVPGMFSRACSLGVCCEEVRDQATAPFPEDVGFTSIYSRGDGVVDWRACLDPAARHVEVDSSHIGMAVNAEVYREVADTLAFRRSAADRASAARWRADPPSSAVSSCARL